MADNVTIKDAASANAVVATDEVTDGTLGTVQVQYVKLMDGTLNSTNKLVVDSAGAVSANITNATLATTQSGTWNVGLNAGTNTIGNVGLNASTLVVGKVGVDQTTVGTTNAVSLKYINTTAIVTGGVNGSQGVGGVTAAAATVTGNPVRIGAKAITANPTAVTDNQVSNIVSDKIGRQVVVQGQIRELTAGNAATITNTTSAATIIAAQGAGVFADITSLTVTNGNTTPTTVTLSDGTNSYVYNVSGGGGFTIPFNPPLPASTANTAWTLTCGTAVTSIYCSLVYVKNI